MHIRKGSSTRGSYLAAPCRACPPRPGRRRIEAKLQSRGGALNGVRVVLGGGSKCRRGLVPCTKLRVLHVVCQLGDLGASATTGVVYVFGRFFSFFLPINHINIITFT